MQPQQDYNEVWFITYVLYFTIDQQYLVQTCTV